MIPHRDTHKYLKGLAGSCPGRLIRAGGEGLEVQVRGCPEVRVKR